MRSIILSACGLVAVTMAVHAAGITVLLRSLMRLHGPNLAKIFGVIVIFGDNILTERLGFKALTSAIPRKRV